MRKKHSEKSKPAGEISAEPDAPYFADESKRLKWELSCAHESLGKIVAEYGKHVLAPRILAERRRRAGDSAARISDYHCRCRVSKADAVPLCRGYRPDCRFAYRRDPEDETVRTGDLKYDIGLAEARKLWKALHLLEPRKFLDELHRINRLSIAALRRVGPPPGWRP